MGELKLPLVLRRLTMSGDTRFKNGLALGPYNNFFATSANVFVENDTTPDVTLSSLWFSNNTTNTAITNFDLTVVGGGAASNAGAFEGKLLRVVLLDDSTSLINGARLVLQGSNNLAGLNNTIDLLYHNSAWVEFGRSYNQSNVISVDTNNIKTASSIFPNTSTGNVIITGRGPSVIIRMLQDSTGNWTMRRAIGGQQGDFLTLYAGGDSHSLVICNSAAADTFVCNTSASSTQFRLVSSAAITFIRVLNKWHEVTSVSPNSSNILGL